MSDPSSRTTCGSYILRCRDRELTLSGDKPRIMGILNLTPDSFFDGGRYASLDAGLEHALAMVRDGADIIDIGGESTRPGSDPVPDSIQIRRIVPVMELLRDRSDVLISVDTTRTAVASAAIQAGAHIVNDTSSFEDDPLMARVVSGSGVGVVLMHRKGRPATMQDAPDYEAFMPELLDSLRLSIRTAEAAGISSDRIVIDPGVGFGKRFEDNIEIHRSFRQLHLLSRPVLFGSSRKSFLGKLPGVADSSRLPGTIASNVIAAWQGAHILRVHDVAEIREAVALVSAVRSAPSC